MLYCPHCSNKLQSDARFCVFCGQDVGQEILSGQSGQTTVGTKAGTGDDQKRSRYKKYGEYMIAIAALLFIIAYVTRIPSGLLSLLIFVIGGGGLVTFFTNR